MKVLFISRLENMKIFQAICFTPSIRYNILGINVNKANKLKNQFICHLNVGFNLKLTHP